MDKKSFLENEKQVEQDMTAKEILADRVKELGLGYEQVEVEPKVMLPTYNYLGEVDKFEAYENTVGAMQFISNPSFSAESQELSSYYLGGTFVTNTCEKMLTINPLEEPEAPESVVTEVEELELTGKIEVEDEPCIIPLENISGWEEDLSTWDKPVDENGNEIAGEWIVLNGGAVYTGGETATLTISFIPVAKDIYEPVNINKVFTASAAPPPDLLTNLHSHFSFGDTTFNGKSLVSGDTIEMKQFVSDAAFDASVGKITGGIDLSLRKNAHLQCMNANSNKMKSFGKGTSQSFSFWYKPISCNANYNIMTILGGITKPVASAINSITVQIGIRSTLRPYIIASDSANVWYTLNATKEITLDKYHLFNVVFDTDNRFLKIYCDTEEIATDNNLYDGWFVEDNSVSGLYLCCGTAFSMGLGTVCPGYMDELTWWDGRAIGESEIKYLYNNGEGISFEDFI